MPVQVSDHESQEIGAMVRRMLRALVRRAALGDVAALVELRKLRDEVPDVLAIGTRLSTKVYGGPYTPEDLVSDLGIARQNVRKLATRTVDVDGWNYYTKGMDV